MDIAQRDTLIDALENSIAQNDFDLYGGAQKLKRFIDRWLPLIEASQSREALETYFTCDEEIAEERVGQYLSLFETLPRIVEEYALEALRGITEDLPKATPGPPTKISPETKRRIIAAIGRLNMKGVSIGIAQTRAAQEAGLSKRSVQRVWQQREQISTQVFQNIEDVWRFLGLL